jgi:hypothetical protein
MKSISNQYKLLKEGKMSQYNFMRSVRTAFPQYVTNVTSFEDAIKILRKKNLLSENIVKQLEKGIEVEKEHTKDEVKAAKIALDHLKEDPKYYTKLTKAGLEESHEANTQWIERFIDILKDRGAESIIPDNIDLGEYEGMTPEQAASKFLQPVRVTPFNAYSDPEIPFMGMTEDNMDDNDAETLAMIDKIAAEKAGEEEVMAQYDESLNEAKSWTNTSGKEMYAQFRELDNLNAQEVLIGIDFEMESNHELSKAEAAKIVARKLKQNPNFYTAHALAGKEMKEIPTIGKLIPGSDQMRPLKNEADLVDKDNGLKPVKGVEKIKASANKATKETNKPVGTISLMSLVAKTSKGVTKMVATGEKMKVVKEGYEDFLAQKKGEEAEAAKIKQATNADNITFSINDKATTPEGDEITIKGFMVDKDGKTKAIYMAKTGMYADAIDVDGLTKKKDIRPGVNLGKYNLKDLTEIVREVLAEMESDDEVNTDVMLGLGETMDGRDNLTDTAGHQLDENK